MHMLLKVFRAHMQNLVSIGKNYAAMRKIMMAATLTTVSKDEQQNVIWFLTLENVLGSEIHTRICMVYGVQNVITKSIVNQWVQRFKVGQTSRSIRKMPLARYVNSIEKWDNLKNKIHLV